jgi:predicted nucleic acid-binding protein
MATSRANKDKFAVSDLARLECRVTPLGAGDASMVSDFDAFFAAPDLLVVSLLPQVIDQATDIRAQYRFKLADSLHLASAVEAGCDVFLTHDARLRRFPHLTVEVLS